MKVLDLFRREAGVDGPRFLVLAALSGLSNAGVLAIINVAAANVQNQADNFRNLVLFGLAIAIFVVTQRTLMVEVCDKVERLIDRMRTRLVERARRAEYLDLDEVGRSEIYACLTRETQILSQAAPNVVIAVQSAILVGFTLVYMAALSQTAFLLSSGFTLLGAMIHLSRSGEVKRQLRAAFERENDLIEGLSDMLDGFKEVKMSTERSDAIAARIARISAEVTRMRIGTQTAYATDFVTSQVTFFILTGIMVFVVPNVSQAHVEVVVMTTTASLFLIGPVSNVVGSLPIFANANAAAENITRMEARLGEAGAGPAPVAGRFAGFRRIVLDGATFSHHAAGGESGFRVGPVDLTVERGVTLFLTGGNGSGKTTFIRMLIGLYPASSGVIRVDGTPVTAATLADYRNLFSVIFSDNHLFSELYGIQEIDAALADELFALLEMQHKSKLENGRFTVTKLSGGQRKRLALIGSLLEKRPICVFDEWAADQDPHFREKFYRVVLPFLKGRGITVIAITHDDAYFDLADIHVDMKNGRLDVVRTASVMAE
ncbi:cyclic peptide export ABC transporter [Methylobacterium sp. EM32]|uniref:cyclic peptide export ABC transporter n=1 Tax=Methylobacterium sp. EM32 TaxID=3163481 RepID=UPI0033B645B5